MSRWTQQDPIVGFVDPRTANRYISAGNEPVNLVDPSGARFRSVKFLKAVWEVRRVATVGYCSANAVYVAATPANGREMVFVNGLKRTSEATCDCVKPPWVPFLPDDLPTSD